MTDLMTRLCLSPAANGFPLPMWLVGAVDPIEAIMATTGTGFPKGFYDRFAHHLVGRVAAVTTAAAGEAAASEGRNMSAG